MSEIISALPHHVSVCVIHSKNMPLIRSYRLHGFKVELKPLWIKPTRYRPSWDNETVCNELFCVHGERLLVDTTTNGPEKLLENGCQLMRSVGFKKEKTNDNMHISLLNHV